MEEGEKDPEEQEGADTPTYPTCTGQWLPSFDLPSSSSCIGERLCLMLGLEWLAISFSNA